MVHFNHPLILLIWLCLEIQSFQGNIILIITNIMQFKVLIYLVYPCKDICSIKIPYFNLGKVDTIRNPSMIRTNIRVKSFQNMVIGGRLFNLDFCAFFMSYLCHIIIFSKPLIQDMHKPNFNLFEFLFYFLLET